MQEATIGATPTNVVEGRLGVAFDSSTCMDFNFFPGRIGVAMRNFEEIGPFCNTGGSTVCVTVSFFPNDCVEAANAENVLVIPAAYTEFNPAEFGSGNGYLGTIGLDNPNQFQFLLDAGEQFVVIGQQVRDLEAPENGLGCTFGVSVEFDSNCGEA